jgi:hypothetical protein
MSQRCECCQAHLRRNGQNERGDFHTVSLTWVEAEYVNEL